MRTAEDSTDCGAKGRARDGKGAAAARPELTRCWLGDEGKLANRPSSRDLPFTGLALGVMPAGATDGRREPFLWATLPAGVEGTVRGCADVEEDDAACAAVGGTTGFHALLDDEDCDARRRKERMADWRASSHCAFALREGVEGVEVSKGLLKRICRG